MDRTAALFIKFAFRLFQFAAHAIFDMVNFLVNIAVIMAPVPKFLTGFYMVRLGGSNKMDVIRYYKRGHQFFKLFRVFGDISLDFLAFLLCLPVNLYAVLVRTGVKKHFFA